MYTIAIIRTQTIQFDMEPYVRPLLYMETNKASREVFKAQVNAALWQYIQEHIEFRTIAQENIMDVACHAMIEAWPDRNENDFQFHTQISYAFNKGTLELLHVIPRFDHARKANTIGSLLSLQHTWIDGTCVLFMNAHHENNIALTNIQSAHILRALRKRFYHSAILLRNDQYYKYYYQNAEYLIHAIFNTQQTETSTFQFYAHTLQMYFQWNDTLVVNKIATRIHGRYPLYGPVLLFHTWEDKVHASLSITEVQRFNRLAFGPLTLRIEKPCEELTTQNYYNRYMHIQDCERKLKQVCQACAKPLTHFLSCTKCFRLKACSRTCQQQLLASHKSDCINDRCWQDLSFHNTSS